jgi:hypothetical protein
MEASFFIILFFVVVGVLSLVKSLSGSTVKPPIDLNAKPFQSSRSVQTPLGSFLAYQYIGKDEQRFDFFAEVEYDEIDKSMIILIDGRGFGTKMKLDFQKRNSLIQIIDKAIEWSKKANDAELTANKLISSFTAVVSFKFDNQIYYVHDCKIYFNFYNDKEAISGSKIFILTNDYDIGGVSIPHPTIFIENHQFEKIKSLLSEETIQSVLNERTEKNRIQDEILT